MAYTTIDDPGLYFNTVLYTGNGTDDTDIAHSLSAVPHVMLVKCRTHGEYWAVYHHKNTSAPNTDYLLLNVSPAKVSNPWGSQEAHQKLFLILAFHLVHCPFWLK